MKVVLKNGFECEIKDRAFEDFRMVQITSEMKKADKNEELLYVPEFFERLLGKEQLEDLLQYLEETAPDGIATQNDMLEVFQELQNGFDEAKKNNLPSDA